MNISVLFSPGAGQKNIFDKIGRVLTEKFSEDTIFTCNGKNGYDFLSNANEVVYEAGVDYRGNIFNMTGALSQKGKDLFICIGGDGLASYVADAVITLGLDIPLLGIGAGSANVGPIVSLTVEELEKLNSKELVFLKVDGIKVFSQNKHYGYGFNDVVIGNVFLGTVNEKIVSLSVEEMCEKGEKKIIKPSADITKEGFSIYKNDKSVKMAIKRPAQIIISPLQFDNFYGRGITGALCRSALTDLKAALALFEENVIYYDYENYEAQATFKCEQLMFNDQDIIRMEELSDYGHIVIDGNPFIRSSEDVISVKLVKGIISIARTIGMSKSDKVDSSR